MIESFRYFLYEFSHTPLGIVLNGLFLLGFIIDMIYTIYCWGKHRYD